MFSTGLIVFRETLEAALFVGIIAACTRGLAHRSVWLASGILMGIAGSVGMAFGLERLGNWAEGLGQDLVNVVIVVVALVMLAWHCIWISPHAQEMVRTARRLGSTASQGHDTLWALSLAVAMAVLREGSETVIFVAGFWSGTSGGNAPMLLGAGLGLFAGVGVGSLIYLSLARIKTQHVFLVTNGLVLILAGSLASQLAKNLIQAGLVDHGTDPLWDISPLLSNDSAPGVFLHALMGYDAKPSALQLLFYCGTIGLIWMASRQAKAWAQRA